MPLRAKITSFIRSFGSNRRTIVSQLAATVFQTSGAAIALLDNRYCLLDVNPAFTRLTGFGAAELKGVPFSDLYGFPFNPVAAKELDSLVTDCGFWKGELLIHKKTGGRFPATVWIDAATTEQCDISHFVVLFVDISDHKQLEDELRYHAEIDPLTGLPNRKLLFQRLDSALASAKRFNYKVGVLYLDLDGFKQINDRLGHARGDNVLIEVAGRLKNCVREVDTPARLGGDEFIVVLNGTSQQLIAATAQRILDSLTLTVTEQNLELRVSASIGIAIFPEDSVTAQGLLKCADTAMYQAKYQGKQRFCWHGNLSD